MMVGLLRLTMGSSISRVVGWMLPLHGFLYCVATDMNNDTLVFGLFNGLGASRVYVFDGIILLPVGEMGRSPVATGSVVGDLRTGGRDLTGDIDADDQRLAEMMKQEPLAPEGSVSEETRGPSGAGFWPPHLQSPVATGC